MGKLLILSVTNGEEQILDRIKDFLAEEPGIEIVEPPATKHTLTFLGLELHLRKQTVKWRGQPLHLTHLEFFTLAYLARHPGWVFTQEQIYEAVWHEFPEDCGAAVVNIISQLRRKMGPGNPIRTVPHSLVDLFLRENPAGVPGQISQREELQVRKVERLALPLYRLLAQVQLQAGKGEGVLRSGRLHDFDSRLFRQEVLDPIQNLLLAIGDG